MLKEEQQRKIYQHFIEHVPEYKCPICQAKKFKFMDGYILMPLQADVYNFSFTTNSGLSCIAVCCDKCGYTSLFRTTNLALAESATD